MHLNFLFKKDNDNISKKGKVNVPDGLFTKCPKCSKMILTDELFLDNCVCHSCGYYFKIDAKTSAGFMKFCPRPPNNCFTIIIANTHPTIS